MTIRQWKNKYKFLTMDEKKYFVFRQVSELRNVEYKRTYLQNRKSHRSRKQTYGEQGEKRWGGGINRETQIDTHAHYYI